VGKGLAARAIHQLSPRNARPMVKVNCAVLPANLIERAVINTRGPSLRLMDTLAAPGELGLGSPRTRTLAESEADCIVRVKNRGRF
jgi:hypothetical protein